MNYDKLLYECNLFVRAVRHTSGYKLASVEADAVFDLLETEKNGEEYNPSKVKKIFMESPLEIQFQLCHPKFINKQHYPISELGLVKGSEMLIKFLINTNPDLYKEYIPKIRLVVADRLAHKHYYSSMMNDMPNYIKLIKNILIDPAVDDTVKKDLISKTRSHEILRRVKFE